MDANYTALSTVATAETLPTTWAATFKRFAAGTLFALGLTVAGTVLISFTLLAAWVLAPVIAIGVAVAIQRHDQRRRALARA